MKTSVTVTTTKVFVLEGSDLHALITKAGFQPEGWKFYSVKVKTNDGSDLTITLEKTEQVE